MPPPSQSSGANAYPLLDIDPPSIGGFWLDARLTASRGAVVYFAHNDLCSEVMLLSLNSGAGNDAAVRDRLAGEVNKMHADTVVARGGKGQDSGRLGYKFTQQAEIGETEAWVALAYDGSPNALAEANRLLETIEMASGEQPDEGPDYRLHWVRDAGRGSWKSWPLPWPGRHDRAGVLPIFAGWLLTLVITGLGLLIAVLLFQNTPPEQPPPPVPTQSEQAQDPSDADSSAGEQSVSPSAGETSEQQPQDGSSGGSAAAPSSERSRL